MDEHRLTEMAPLAPRHRYGASAASTTRVQGPRGEWIDIAVAVVACECGIPHVAIGRGSYGRNLDGALIELGRQLERLGAECVQ